MSPKFQIGDTVMHWSHGLGRITALEERKLLGESQLYYAVQIRDFNVWVPADDRLSDRMRLPTSAPAFKKLLAILKGPAQVLPDDRQERKMALRANMGVGTVAATCEVIRDLTAREATKPLNDDDKAVLQRARAMLLGEWGYSLKVAPSEAEDELHRILKQPPSAVKS